MERLSPTLQGAHKRAIYHTDFAIYISTKDPNSKLRTQISDPRSWSQQSCRKLNALILGALRLGKDYMDGNPQTNQDISI